ncbi:hypothetical protein Tco_0214531 [Tanacetum coccineum]
MANLIFADSHNMVSYLEKSEDNADFAEIVDFLNASPIRHGKDFLGTVTPLLATMLIQSQAVEGEGSGQLTEPQHTPTTASPSHATKISQSSRPTTLVADETVHEERGDNVERAATTATSLDTEQGSGVNTPGSDEERIELKELMDMCTKLSDRVLDLENVKNAQALEIQKLKKRFQEDSETQGRYGHDIGVNTASTSITTVSINITTAEPVTTASAPVTTVGVSVSTTEPSTPTTTITPIEDEDLTIAQTLMKMKSKKSKAKGVTMQEPSESGTRVRVPSPQIDPKDKGKAKMVEPEKLKKKKDQIEYDANVAQRLQAELDEEVRLKREREEEASKAANIDEWDDVQAMMDANYELTTKLQEQEREELFVELMNERKKHFARLRAKE